MSLHEPEKHLRQLWALDESRAFLNHGSYGACPKAVLDYQNELRQELESSPVWFMSKRYPQLLEELRGDVAEFLKAKPEHLVFVENATSGVNTILSSLKWSSGEEIVLSDHGYNACANAARVLQERFGVVLKRVEFDFPDFQDEKALDSILNALSSRTRLVMLDHVTSPTALVFPVEKWAQELAARGVPLLIDGAHAPGMLALDLESLGEAGVTYYTGNFHKWCCAPKGAAFLWVHRNDQKEIRPLVTSHGYNSQSSRNKFLEEFDWCGTFDPTSRLSVSVALNFLGELYPGGWTELRGRCRELLLRGRDLVLTTLPNQELVGPEWLGQIVSLQLPCLDAVELYDLLYDDFRLDTMITQWKDNTLLRLSAAAYNQIGDYQKLADALKTIEARTWN